MRKTSWSEAATAEPELGELIEDYRWCVDQRGSNVLARARENREARVCFWPGQSRDGKRWKPKANQKEVRPWPGSSDVRVHLTDQLINEDAALLQTVWRRNRCTVMPTESNDAEFANRMTQLLRWLKYTQMAEATREMKLASNWVLERGVAVMGIFWDRQYQLSYEELDYDQVQNLAAQAQQWLEAGTLPEGVTPEQLAGAARFPTLMLDEASEAEACEVLAMYYPDVAKDNIRRAVRALRREGHARFPRPYSKIDRPCIRAFSPNEDIFLSPEATTLEGLGCPSIFWRELLSETRLRERAHSHGWNQTWIEEVAETQRGSITGLGDMGRVGELARGANRPLLATDRLFEVVHAFRWRFDDSGVPGIYYTCFHEGLNKGRSARKRASPYAYHAMLNYEHGGMPFALIERECRSRDLDHSRGYGEITWTHEMQIKAGWDMRIDRGSIATLPPLAHPSGMPPTEWGPGAMLGTSQPERYRFLEVPRLDLGTKEIEESIQRHVSRYYGRRLEDNAVESQALRQALTDNWLEFWQRIDTQILQLMQQFAPDEIFFRVVGSDKGRPLKATREEIQGSFDVRLSYNVGDLDAEERKSKLELLQLAMQWNTNGRVDMDEAMQIGFELLDPNMGERLLRPGESAAQSEIEDERNVFARLMAGLDEPVKPGQAYGLRLQWLQAMLQQNPTAQQKYQSDEGIRDVVNKRMQRLQHQVQQVTVNAEIGRQGA